MVLNRFFIGAALALAGVAGSSVHADTVALTPTQNDGSQNFNSTFGMDFDVLKPITVTRLGVFDNHNDGVLLTNSDSQPIVIQIWNLDTGVSLVSAPFGGGTGDGTHDPSVNLFFKDVALNLAVGHYYVSEDFGGSELFENDNNHPTINTGGGAIAFVGSGRASFDHNSIFPFDPSGFVDGGPANRYAGPTFAFFVPEPASLAGLALGGLALISRRRKA